MTIKLAAIDLDGTLLHDDMTVSAYTKEIIGRVAARGIRIVAATGRMFDSARAKVKLLGLPDTPVICYTGAWAGMSESGTILWQDGLSLDTARTILSEGKAHGWVMQSYIDDEIYIEKETPLEILCRRFRAKPAQMLGDDFYRPTKPPTRLIIVEPSAEKRETIRTYLDERYCNEAEMVYPGDIFLDIHKRGISKAAALSRLGAKWGITMSETVSFGNTENDVSMLSATALSFAVANAEPAAKQAAKEILPRTNNEDAVAHKLEELFL